MTLEKLKEMLVPGTKYVCTYGDSRIEEYSIDRVAMFGYYSGGGYSWTRLDDCEFDITLLRTVSAVKDIWKRTDDE